MVVFRRSGNIGRCETKMNRYLWNDQSQTSGVRANRSSPRRTPICWTQTETWEILQKFIQYYYPLCCHRNKDTGCVRKNLRKMRTKFFENEVQSWKFFNYRHNRPVIKCYVITIQDRQSLIGKYKPAENAEPMFKLCVDKTYRHRILKLRLDNGKGIFVKSYRI